MNIDHDCDVFVIDSSNFYNVNFKKKKKQQLLTKVSDYQDFLKTGRIIQLLIAQNSIYKIYIDFCSSIPGKECGHRIIHKMEIFLISSQYSTTASAGNLNHIICRSCVF